MIKLNTVLCFLILSVTIYSQNPDFSNSGFGSAATGGGTNGATVPVSNLAQLRAALLRSDACIVQISGKISGISATAKMEQDSNLLEVRNNKTILGIGSDAFLSNIQLYLKNAQNIIIRNIKFSMIGSNLESDADMISIATTSSGECKDIWIDHCEFFNITPTLPETSAKKDLYDGMIDIKKTSHNITISWNYFHDHWKCSLIGYTDTDTYDRKITYHHNYFKNISSRVPSYRGGTGHIYNNYFDGLPNPATQPGSDGVNTREGACLKVEGNYFKNYKNTIYCATGDVVICGNAYGTGNRFENSPGMTAGSCSSFMPPYSYKMDSAADIPYLVPQWSGVGKSEPDAAHLSVPTNRVQSVQPGSAITDIVFTWSGGATDVVPEALPDGLAATKNAVNKTLTISGIPTRTGTYKIATVGGTGSVSIDGTISFAVVIELEKTNKATGFSLYPSITGESTVVSFHSPGVSKAQLTVTDMNGRLISRNIIYPHPGVNSHTLDFGGINQGVYNVTLQIDGSTYNRKLVKR